MTDIEDRVGRVVNELAELDGVQTRVGISHGDAAILEREVGFGLPEAYRCLLLRTNGLEVGYTKSRVFGFGPGAPVDVMWFNDPDTWKFAWRWHRDDMDQWFYFGATWKGNLVSAKRSDLEASGGDPPLFILTPPLRRTKAIGVTFIEWFERGLVGVARTPVRDSDDRAIRERFPSMRADQFVVESPLSWVTGDADIEHALLLPVDKALIAEGDLMRESTRLTAGDQVVGVQAYEDEQGRERLRYRTRQGL